MTQDISIEEIVRLDSNRINSINECNDFIATAPRIAAKCLEMDRKLQVIEPAFLKIIAYVQDHGNESWRTVGDNCHDAIIRRCKQLDKANKELVEALKESIWQIKRMSTILAHHGIGGGLKDTDGPIKRAEEALTKAGVL